MYRETTRTRANAAARRARIRRAARHLVAEGGFGAASVAEVARRAGCSTGLVYSYFRNREALLAAVFAEAAEHELEAVARGIADARTPEECAGAVVRVFIERAVAGRRLAHALLIEPVPEAVQRERLRLRRSYAELIAAGLSRTSAGAGRTPIAGPDAVIAARALVGTISENLIDVLDDALPSPEPPAVDHLVRAITRHSRRALGAP